MTSARFHPLGAVTAVVFLVAVLLPPISFGVPFTFAALLAFLGLASPFVVLLLAHIQICKTWRRNLLVVLLNVPLFLGWQLAVVANWYLQAGLLGALNLRHRSEWHGRCWPVFDAPHKGAKAND